jgi:hypothetical protein
MVTFHTHDVQANLYRIDVVITIFSIDPCRTAYSIEFLHFKAMLIYLLIEGNHYLLYMI